MRARLHDYEGVAAVAAAAAHLSRPQMHGRFDEIRTKHRLPRAVQVILRVLVRGYQRFAAVQVEAPSLLSRTYVRITCLGVRETTAFQTAHTGR